MSEAADWTIVIPVKGTPFAKSRLGAGGAVTEAIALDTVSAAAAVARVVVVTPRSNPAPFADLGARRVDEVEGGLRAAIETGIESAGSGSVAVLLGDLPGLSSEQLRSTLVAAAQHSRAMVADAAGDGTVLVTALAGVPHRQAFGPGSRAAHLAAGYVELAVGAAPGLRRDVDTPFDLALLGPLLGPRTRAALAAEAEAAG
ncbi:MAG: CofC, 2-Phospho-l-lactate Guanylyltransferase [Frondihabitans sp.]|nr:CofC, 2-Phospho-l-lactate Guanylyltransferase [Frondihabitans sp.]